MFSALIPASSRIQSSGSVGSKMFILGNPTNKKLCMAPASHLFMENYMDDLLYAYTAYRRVESKKMIKVDKQLVRNYCFVLF